MPSKSQQQAKTMRAAAHDPEFAKMMDIDQKAAEDFMKADKKLGKKHLHRLPKRVEQKADGGRASAQRLDRHQRSC